MKTLVILLFIGLGLTCRSQEVGTLQKKIRVKWKLDGNHLITGGLVSLGGSCKGFNETLFFHYKVFARKFPNADRKWFDPRLSWMNKYKNRNPDDGPKFPLSTTLFAFTTDQYHLNNFIGRSAILSALVIKIGDGKKPFKYYLIDLLYYGLCYQAGFALTYYPFSSWKQNKR